MNAPTPAQVAAYFTVETAREMGKRGAAARIAEKQRLQAAEAALKAIPIATPLSVRIMRAERQLDQVDRLIEDCDDAKELSTLSQAKERLQNAWAMLTGFPKPGVRKSSRRPDRAMVEPTPQPIDQPPLDTSNEPNG